MIAPRPQSQSLTELTEYVLPQHANILGNVFGGQIMAWLDLSAAICAQRHTGKQCVTAAFDEILFHGPVRVGEVAHFVARVTATFRTSLEVEVIVEGEDAMTRRKWPCARCLATFVAIDDDRKPTPIAPLLLDDADVRASQEAGARRRELRLAKR